MTALQVTVIDNQGDEEVLFYNWYYVNGNINLSPNTCALFTDDDCLSNAIVTVTSVLQRRVRKRRIRSYALKELTVR
jgi:hypothetical protein